MIKRGVKTALCALAALVCGALPVAAQQSQNNLPPNPGVRSVDVDVIGEILYNSNVAGSDQALATQRGLPSLGDVIFTPTAALKAVLPVGREALFLDASAGYDFYSQDTILNRERINVFGGIMGPAGPCKGDLTGSYSRNQTDVTDETNLLEPNVQNVESHETINFDALCGRTTGFAPSVSLSQAWDDNSAIERQLVNYHSFSATGGLAYRRPALGAITLFGNFITTTYPNQVDFLNPDPMAAGYNVYSGGIKYDRHLGARIEGVVSISYTDLQEAISGATGFSGFTYSGDVTYRATSRLQLHLNAYRATEPSVSVGSTFSINEEFLGELLYRAGPRINLNLGASSLNENFSQSPAFDLIAISNETTYNVYGEATYALNRRLTFVLDLRRVQRDADLPEFNYVSYQVGLTAKGTF